MLALGCHKRARVASFLLGKRPGGQPDGWPESGLACIRGPWGGKTGGVSDTSLPASPNAVSAQAPGTPIFRAFAERRPSRLRWALLALPLVAVPAVWAMTRAHADLAQVVTTRGIMTVRRGMSPTEVQGVLGRPVTVQRSEDGRTECYKHGRPSMESPTFRIYSACYEEGELRAVTVRKYEAFAMDAQAPAGAVAPQ